MANTIDFKRISSDNMGNPRYVCHFLSFLTEHDNKNLKGFDLGYEVALNKAKQFGGRKFHNKQYGGGIVFSTYNIEDLSRRIQESLK